MYDIEKKCHINFILSSVFKPKFSILYTEINNQKMKVFQTRVFQFKHAGGVTDVKRSNQVSLKIFDETVL